MKSIAALESWSMDGAGLIAALLSPDGTLPSVEGCIARMIGIRCPSQAVVVQAVAMVPKTETPSSFDWLHDANGLRFLGSLGSRPVETAAWSSVRKFVEAVVTSAEKTIYNDDPEATKRKLIDALGVQLFGKPGSKLPVADPVDTRTELVFSRVLTKREAAKVAKQMPVKWRPAIWASAKSYDEDRVDVEDGRVYELTTRRRGHRRKFVAKASLAATVGGGIAVYTFWKLATWLLLKQDPPMNAITGTEMMRAGRPVRRFWELVNQTAMSEADLQSVVRPDPEACNVQGTKHFDLGGAGNVICERPDGERGCFGFGPPYGFDLMAVRQGINDYWNPKECGMTCYDPVTAAKVVERALVERLGAGLPGPNLNITALNTQLNTQLNTEALIGLRSEILGAYPLDPECSVGCEGCLGDSSEDAVNQLLKCYCDYVGVRCDGVGNGDLNTPLVSSNAGFDTTVGELLSQLRGPIESKRVDSCVVECRRAQQ